MNPSEIKDFDIDSSEEKKCDSIHIPKMAPKKTKKITMAATLVLFFVIMAIYSYDALDALFSGSHSVPILLVFIGAYIDENRIKLLYPIFLMSTIIISIFLFGVNDWSSSLLKITKRIIIGLSISVTSVLLGSLIYVSVINHKESRRKAAETFVTIDESLKAEQVLKDYIIEYPDDPYGLIDLAVIYWNSGKRDESLVIFKEFQKQFNFRKTFQAGRYCNKKIESIALTEFERLDSFVHKGLIPSGFYDDTKQLEMLCKIRPLAYDSEIHGEKIPEWMTENSFVRWRQSYTLHTFASWLDTKDNNGAIESAFQFNHEIKTLNNLRVISVFWATACRRNNLPDAEREAYQLMSDIDERCQIEMKKLEKK